MTKLTTRIEVGFTAGLWLAVAIFLPMAALTPIDSGEAEARSPDTSPCTKVVVDMLRVCPVSAL